MRLVALPVACFGLLLLSLPALAQQPVLAPPPAAPAAPTSPAPIPSSAPAAALPPPAAPVPLPVGEIIGQTYNVELASGTAFIGVLTAISAEELSFNTKDLGLLVIKRVNIRQLNQLTTEQARLGYDYVGNGNRLFFAPTARNLRRGEGTVQNIDIFLIGVNYGISNNFSVGALFSWIPAAGSDNIFALTPKVSFPVQKDLHVGAGALIVFAGGEAFTLGYANTTYGSADNNLTAGIGYALANGETSNTPVFVIGGARRVSRRVSLLNETYILRINDDYSDASLIGGIAGLRISGQRLSGGLALAYGYFNEKNSGPYGGSYEESYFEAIPFADVTFRFGKTSDTR